MHQTNPFLDYRLLIARRYLSSPRSVSLISRITGISIVGVTLGVAALIVVLSVLNGFFLFVRDMLVSYDPHIRIVSTTEHGMTHPESLVDLALTNPLVLSAAPYVEGKALLLHDGQGDVNKVVIVRGVQPGSMGEENGFSAETTIGTFDTDVREGRPGIVLGHRLGERLMLLPGTGTDEASRIALMSAPAIERTFTRILSGAPFRQFEVRGLVRIQSVFDESHVFVGLHEAQRLFSLGDQVSGLEIRLNDLERADEVKAWLDERLDGDGFEVLTWYDLQKTLYDVMRLEKFGASLVLFLIVIVAAFNIVGSLTMIVIEKRRDVGVLRAMGVSRRNIRRIFLSEGLYIGLVGAGAGVLLGLALSWAQQTWKLVPMAGSDSAAFLIDAYPVAIRIFDVAGIGLAALLLCVLAAWYPATRAASIDPAEAVATKG